jgi:hypothetical protein
MQLTVTITFQGYAAIRRKYNTRFALVSKRVEKKADLSESIYLQNISLY